jgi:beta-lactam-binding protein with PASTA domain
MTLFVKGIADAPGTVPDVVGMGASDAVYLLEKEGLTTNINGFGRVFRQSLKPGVPIVNGETISLELGFDKLEIMKRDSIKANIFIQKEQLGLVQEGDSVKVEEAKPNASKSPAEKPKPSQEAIDKWKAKVAAQKELEKKNAAAGKTEKPKPSQEAIDKWKAKVAAQKELEKKNAAEGKTEKPKPSQEAIDKWKAKVAAQKALDAKNADAKKTE